MSIAETIKRSELFLGLDNTDIEKIVDLPSCQVVEYDDQGIIFREGEEAKYLYVLEEGKVSLVLKLPASASEAEQQTEWRTITRGGIFGWSALVPPHIRIGLGISKGRSRVVSISGDELRALFDKDAHLGYEVMKSLVKVIASRVWNIERLLATGKRSPFI